MTPANVTREEFLRAIMSSGFTYVEAERAYASFMRVIEDGVCMGSRIYLGNVGVIFPSKQAARVVEMRFKSVPGGARIPVRREYNIGIRLRYSFRLFKRFIAKKRLHWTL